MRCICKTGLIVVAMLLTVTGCSDSDNGGGQRSRGRGEQTIERCRHCFHEKIREIWQTPPPCIKGHGHVYQIIGTVGNKRFGCTKCGRTYFLKSKPVGYRDCPSGQACNWRQY